MGSGYISSQNSSPQGRKSTGLPLEISRSNRLSLPRSDYVLGQSRKGYLNGRNYSQYTRPSRLVTRVPQENAQCEASSIRGGGGGPEGSEEAYSESPIRILRSSLNR